MPLLSHWPLHRPQPLPWHEELLEWYEVYSISVVSRILNASTAFHNEAPVMELYNKAESICRHRLLMKP
jgi:hypothetical protein